MTFSKLLELRVKRGKPAILVDEDNELLQEAKPVVFPLFLASGTIFSLAPRESLISYHRMLYHVSVSTKSLILIQTK